MIRQKRHYISEMPIGIYWSVKMRYLSFATKYIVQQKQIKNTKYTSQLLPENWMKSTSKMPALTSLQVLSIPYWVNQLKPSIPSKDQQNLTPTITMPGSTHSVPFTIQTI